MSPSFKHYLRDILATTSVDAATAEYYMSLAAFRGGFMSTTEFHELRLAYEAHCGFLKFLAS